MLSSRKGSPTMTHPLVLFVASVALVALPAGCNKTPASPLSSALAPPTPKPVVTQLTQPNPPDQPATLPPKVDPATAIHLGDSFATVRAALGAPNGQMQLGNKLILTYDCGQVQLVDGKVTSTNFLSTEDFAVQQTQAAQRQAECTAEGLALKARVLADPAFIYAPVAYQFSFWQNFRQLYPDVPCDDQYNRAQQLLASQQQQVAAAPQTSTSQPYYYGAYYPQSYYYRSWPYYRYTTYYREREHEYEHEYHDRDNHDYHDHHTPWRNTPVYSPSYNQITPSQSYASAINNAMSRAHEMSSVRSSTPSDSYTTAVNNAMSSAHGMSSVHSSSGGSSDLHTTITMGSPTITSTTGFPNVFPQH
jgi:hypothetical protein